MELLLVSLFLIPLLIWAAQHGKKLATQTNQAWREAAEQLGGTFLPSEGGVWNAKSRRIVANVDGIDVTVDHYSSTSSENQTTYYTRVRAATRAPTAFSLRVSRAHAFSGLARALGFQDVSIGDRAFDAEHVVKTNDPTTAKLWLNRRVRKRILGAPSYAFALEKGKIKAETSRLETQANAIVGAVRAVVALADGRERVLRAWRELARKHKGSVKPRKQRWATLEFELDGVPITVDTENTDDGHFTFSSAQVVGPALESFGLYHEPDAEQLDDLPGYVLRSRNPDAALAHLSERVRRAIAEFGPSEVRVEEGAVVVSWPGISIDAKELESASALAAMLASGSARGPYR